VKPVSKKELQRFKDEFPVDPNLDLSSVPIRVIYMIRNGYGKLFPKGTITRQVLIDAVLSWKLHPSNPELRNYGQKTHSFLVRVLNHSAIYAQAGNFERTGSSWGKWAVAPCPCCSAKLNVRWYREKVPGSGNKTIQKADLLPAID
jgi:hypothetical protein